MTLVTLQKLDPLRADFPLSEQAIGKLKVGQVIEVIVDAFPGKVFKGTIESLDARVAQDTRTLLVRGRLPNADAKLLPGMFANVTVLVGNPRSVVTVPRTAVNYSLYGDSLYVVKAVDARAGSTAKDAPGGPGEAEAAPGEGERKLVADRRFVKTGQARDDRVAILEGLKAGEEVVTTGQLKLNPGVTIRIDNDQPLIRPEARPKE